MISLSLATSHDSTETETNNPEERNIIEKKEVVPRKSRLFHSLDDFFKDKQPVRWLIDGLVPEGESLMMIFGPSGNGKTYLAIDLAMTLVCQKPKWCGLTAKPAKVIYLCGEGLCAMKERIACWLQQNEIAGYPQSFLITEEGFDLDSADGLKRLFDGLDKELDGFNPDFIIIDTMNLFMAGDENDTRDATRFIKVVKRISVKYHCCIALVHHTGLANEERARGSSAFRGALDIQVSVSRTGNGTIIVKQTKNRYREELKNQTFQLESHILDGFSTENGESVSNAILIPTDAPDSTDDTEESESITFIRNACLAQRKHRNEDGVIIITRNELLDWGKKEWGEFHGKVPLSTELNPRQEKRTLGRLIRKGIIKETAGGVFQVINRDLISDIEAASSLHKEEPFFDVFDTEPTEY